MTTRRYSLFPIEYPDIWKLYCAQRDNFWRVEEITNLAADREDWKKKMTDDERAAAKQFLGFFNSSDQIVTENILKNIIIYINIPEAQAFYAIQAAIEQIHSEAYSLMIESYMDDPDEKRELFEALDRMPAIAKKGDWVLRWLNRKCTLGERLVAFACVEGIFFSAAFAFIFWLGERNLLTSSYTLNKFIRRDEGLHMIFACVLLNYVDTKPDKQTMEAIIKESVEVELEFVRAALAKPLRGLNSTAMENYVRFVANHLCANLDIKPIYTDQLECPLDFMRQIDLASKENFFEHNATNYSKSSMQSANLDMKKLFCDEKLDDTDDEKW